MCAVPSRYQKTCPVDISFLGGNISWQPPFPNGPQTLPALFGIFPPRLDGLLVGWLSDWFAFLLACLLTLIGSASTIACSFSVLKCVLIKSMTVFLETNLVTLVPQPCHWTGLVPPAWHPRDQGTIQGHLGAADRRLSRSGLDFHRFGTDFGIPFGKIDGCVGHN